MNGKGNGPTKGYNNKAYRENHDAIFKPKRVGEGTRYCPKCDADWRGKPIPREHQHLYATDTGYFSRLIGQYDMNQDRTTSWLCPDCGATFPR